MQWVQRSRHIQGTSTCLTCPEGLYLQGREQRETNLGSPSGNQITEGHFSVKYQEWCRAKDFELVNKQAELGWGAGAGGVQDGAWGLKTIQTILATGSYLSSACVIAGTALSTLHVLISPTESGGLGTNGFHHA